MYLISLSTFSLLFLILLMTYLFSITHYFLSSLLVLEAMTLVLLILSIFFCFNLMEGYSMYLITLTLMVCDASIGLTVLVSFVKIHSNDLVSTLSSN
uniref:NADH dehydrogenase subunit 4L n=1 Tax=Hemiphaedusa aff. magaensis RM-2016 TaxID=1885688 RepID=A0A224AD46_9EUPU|nr:NADH dehydrogenase subunit 4L [Hemiphaedusa aff. magaensis RM-2016]